MFWNTFISKFKVNIRNRSLLFWMLVFPIILSTLFKFAFSNILKGEEFETITVAIVNNEAYEENTNFKALIEELKKQKTESNNAVFLNVMEAGEEGAKILLENDTVTSYIILNPDITLVTKTSGYQQTVLKGILDEYQRTSYNITTILSQDHTALSKGLLDKIGEKNEYVKDITDAKGSQDISVIYFYSVIGMVCMYACYLGIYEVKSTQANLSTLACRNAVAPTGKWAKFMAGMLACAVVQTIIFSILYVYMIYVLKIDFGSQFGYVLLTSIIGSLCGLFLGTFIGSISKAGDGAKTGIAIGIIMLFSVLSGMMGTAVKYLADTYLPFIRYINPVGLITDSLYSLYYYQTHTRLWINLISLSVIGAILLISSLLLLRRKKYASI